MKVYRKGLAIAIIVLFIGASVVPSISGNIESGFEKIKSDNINQFDDGLVSYWSFDEGSGNIVYDDSGNGNDGVNYGASWVDGISQTALKFDGINDCVEVTDRPSLDITGDISISTWFKTDEAQCGVILNKFDMANPDNGYCLTMGKLYIPDDTLSFYIAKDSSIFDVDYDYFTTSDGFADGIWHHVVATYTPDGSSRPHIWVDGEEAAGSVSGSPRSSIGASPGYPFRIGAYSQPDAHSVPFDGAIDEVRIYERELSEDEIKFLYNHPNGVSEPPNPPLITGPTNGKAGEEYDYIFIAFDPEEDDLYYYIDWGVDTFDCDWIGPYASGEEVVVSYTWEKRGTYIIKAKAKDIYDAKVNGEH